MMRQECTSWNLEVSPAHDYLGEAAEDPPAGHSMKNSQNCAHEPERGLREAVPVVEHTKNDGFDLGLAPHEPEKLTAPNLLEAIEGTVRGW